MTIIESALERAKSLKSERSTGKAARSSSPRALAAPTRRASDSAEEPQAQFQPHPVSVDPIFVRENRLLMSSAVLEDRGAIAAYGMLRTRLLHRVRAEGWTTIGVTSAAPQDGKSLTAVNLSLSLARERNNMVVLVDLDMRNPTVCRSLGIRPPVELRDFFEQKQRAAQDLFMSIGVDNLLVAGSITPSQNAAELLSSSRLEELLGFIKASVTSPLILVDLPPLPSPEDALVVAPRVDAMLLVAAEGQTPITELRKAFTLLEPFPVAGVVLNRSSEFGRHYAYGYGYGGDRGSD